jgi:hypothetical protein
VPSQDRVRGDEGGYLTEQLTAQGLALRSQSAALIVGQPQSLVTELFSEDTILLLEILDGPLLVLVDPTGRGCEQNLPRS